MTKPIKCCQGQGLIELLLSLPLVILLLSVLATSSYMGYAKLIIQYHNKEYSVCQQTWGSRDCKQGLEQKLKQALIWGTTEIKTHSFSSHKVAVHYKLLGHQLEVEL